jgi:hypothetical protein
MPLVILVARLVARPAALGLSLALAVVGAIGSSACSDTAVPTPTGTVCTDPDTNPLTWESFGQKFMTDYCTHCHATALPRSMRNGAPLYHDYDKLSGVLSLPDHIDEQAGAGPAATNTRMPPARCPSTPGGPLDRDCATPSEAERTQLAQWIACEILRPRAR